MTSIISLYKTIKTWFIRICNFGTSPEFTTVDNQRIYRLNTIALLGLLVTTLSFITDLFTKSPSLIAIDFLMIVNFYSVWLLNKYRLYLASKFNFFVVFVILDAVCVYYVPNIGTENFLFVMVLFGPQILRKKLHVCILSVFYIMVYVFCKTNSIYGYFVSANADYSFYDYYQNLVFAVVFSWILSYLYIANNEDFVLSVESKNEELRQQNTLVNNLMRELNHRVKNNLQLISSLFSIQSHKTRDQETKLALLDARNRIASISIVHSKLYKDESILEVMLPDYLSDLCNYLVQSTGLSNDVYIHLDVARHKFNIRETVHVGLVVNELVTNTFKYGKTEGRSHISIGFESNGQGMYTLSYRDNGPGFPPDFSLKKTRSFGIDLIKTIVDQYDGTIATRNDNGAVVDIDLKL